MADANGATGHRATYDGGGIGSPHLMRHLADIMPGIAADTGRRTIAHHLSRATDAVGNEAVNAFRQADGVRRRMGLDWHVLLGVTPEAEDRWQQRE